MVTGGWF